MIFLVNKPKRKKVKSRAKGASKSKTQKKARKSSAKNITRRVGGTMAAKKKAKAKAKPRSRKRRVTKRRVKKSGSNITLRRVTGRVYKANGRRRRYRRNAGFGRSGVVGTIMAGTKDAAGVLGGLVGTNFIANRIPFGQGNRGIVAAKKLAVAVALGMVAQRVMGRAVAQNMVAGGVAAVAWDFLKDIPVIGQSLSGYSQINGLGLYPTNLMPRNGVGAYPFTGDAAVVDSARMYRN